MQITRTTDYGIRVLTHLAMLPGGTRLTAAELATQSHASETFVAKILQRLVASRLVVSHRGFDGGFELAKEPRTVTVLDIVTALEGPLCLNACLPGGSGCDDAAWCAACDVWSRAQSALAAVLASETLERLATTSARHRLTTPALGSTPLVAVPTADVAG
jgi:Rrf2 family protein